MASYPSGVKTFATRTNGQSIDAAHVDDLQDEVTALEDGLINGIAHDLKPSTDAARDLGAASFRFRKVYGGALALNAQPSCSAYHSTTQSLGNNAWAALSLNSEDFDTGSMHDTSTNNSRVTVPSGGDGIYLVVAGTSFASNATGVRGVRILKNGSTVVCTGQVVTPVAATLEVVCVGVVSLAAGDYLEAQAFQNSGGALNVGGATRETANQLQVVKLF